MIKAFIVDDEFQSRAFLSSMLGRLFPDVQLAGTASNIKDAIEGIDQHKPDIVFLDIQMKGETGFDLLDSLPAINFSLVITSAFDSFAVKAFRFNAIDYLLKPIIEEELAAAVEKIKRQSLNNHYISKSQVEQLYDDMKKPQKPYDKLAIPTADGFTIIQVNDIIYCRANGNYTEFYLSGQKLIISSYTLKQYDELLTAQSFFRTHRSYLVNMQHVKQYRKGEGGLITMSNGDNIELSKTHKDGFLRLLTAGI